MLAQAFCAARHALPSADGAVRIVVVSTLGHMNLRTPGKQAGRNAVLMLRFLTPCIRLQAAQQPARSRERLLLVAAYSVSIYSNLVRTTKPFKELQNSTYELLYPERGYRMIGEKVGAPSPSLATPSSLESLIVAISCIPIGQGVASQEAAHNIVTRARAWSTLALTGIPKSSVVHTQAEYAYLLCTPVLFSFNGLCGLSDPA